MDPRTQERVEEWDSRPFNGGFDGLSDLADGDFSGAVSAAGTWLFMLNGRIVGVVDGDIEDFETASGTRYEAPHPSLPLLCTMEERGGETRANYYTNETPLREVDNTLQSGSFTGYVELSENVLSGDYYAVYYGGRRMAAAYIGNAERLLTGDEAFERAADEVGIYEVIDVEIDVVDVPGTDDAEPDSDPETEPTAGDGAADGAVGADDAGPSTDDGSTADPTTESVASSIEPIDVSSTEPAATDDVTGGDLIEDATDDDDPSLATEIDFSEEQTGITTTDDHETEPEPAAGITDPESSADSDPETDHDAALGGDDSGGATQDAAAETEVVENVDLDAASAASTEPESARPEPPVDDQSTAEADEAVAEADADDAGTATDAGTASSPDLAEVEAAAEELDRNDISWVDEDDEDDDATATGPSAGESAEPEEPTADDGNGLEEQFEREEEWRETRSIPSIDPENSEGTVDSGASRRETKPDRSRSSTTDRSSASSTNATSASSNDDRAGSQLSEQTATTAASTSEPSGTRTDRSREQRSGAQSDAADAADAHADRVAALTEKLETLQERRDALATKADELEAERDRLRSENEELSATVERLQSRIEDLETELERERAQGHGDDADTGVNAGMQLSTQQALSGTNLFVRYASKSQPTLETAHGGGADRSEVASNLRLEHHTEFDSSDAAVDGTPYEEFLPSTMEYRFVDWLTEMLLYEIRDTGNADALGDLYDAIPRIDRAELGATISLADDDTEDVPDQVTFDVVAFDKMGNPLVLVTLNDSREPATKELLAELEEAASAVKANYPDLAAAIAVTSSYFEPGALEVTEQATSGGFLSRGSKLSYVNLSRKDGYHLCLVESRSEGFHMNVPEL